MFHFINEKRNIQVRLVIIPIDDYTNEIITTPRLDITINGKRAEIIKQDGIHIFTNILDENVLKIPKGIYQERSESFLIHEVLNGVLYIRLLPSMEYKQSGSRTVIKGKINPKNMLSIRFINRWQPYRIISIHKEPPMVHIYHSSDFFLEGKSFLIEEEDKKETIHIVQRAPKGSDKKELYFCSKSLQYQYIPHKCILKREYCITANEKGEFYFMVPVPFVKTGVVEIEKTGKEKTGQVITRQFYEGKENELEVFV